MTVRPEMAVTETLDAVEMDLLLEGLARRWGYDLRGYDRSSARPRLRALLRARRAASLSALQERMLRDAGEADRLVAALGRPRLRLFDDLQFWLAFRRRAVPILRTYPTPRLWVPACGHGEEVFALAVILEEEGLGGRAEIYATDLCPHAPRIAPAAVSAAEERHLRAGGTRSLHEHYRSGMRGRLVLGTHSLATDGPLNEFQFVLARGLLSRFGPELRRRTLRLIHDSLCPLGLVALDGEAAAGLAPFVPQAGIWRKTS